jgi:CheY-like chemotaxis protein
MLPPESFHIVVTDSNHHVCDLLQRELGKEGYAVYSPGPALKAYEYLLSSAQINLIILDPQLFHSHDPNLMSKILRNHPEIQIILHTYKDILCGLKTGDNIHQVEKKAESIRSLNDIVHNCFLSFINKERSKP